MKSLKHALKILDGQLAVSTVCIKIIRECINSTSFINAVDMIEDSAKTAFSNHAEELYKAREEFAAAQENMTVEEYKAAKEAKKKEHEKNMETMRKSSEEMEKIIKDLESMRTKKQ